ncbi:T9SS type A sorting domain-containing protein [bacterium]|nr:T9SS type A sorting domain-containing protein [bacterium]
MIEFGSGTLGTVNVTVSISTFTTQGALPNNLPSGISFAGIIYNIELKDANNQLWGTQSLPGSPTIYLSYLDADNNDIVDGTQIEEKNLIIYHWDSNIWKPLTTHVNGTENFVYAYVLHFSTFTLAGTPTLSLFASNNNNVKVYPNPYKKNGGDCIYFKDVTSGAIIKIYTIAGELVDKIEATSNPQGWKVSDKKIASGIYIYIVIGGSGGKSVGKIGIIK